MNICPVGEDSHLGEMSVPFVPAQRSNFQFPWISEGIFCKVKSAKGVMGLCVSRKFNGKLVGHSRLSHVYYGIVNI